MAEQTAAAAVIPTTTAPSSPPQLFPNLPDDISLQILARVPRFHHPFLSLVSKPWRSAISSAELFRTRSLLRTSQFSLYLSLRIHSSFLWYAEQNPQISKRTFIPLPSIPQHPVGSSILALGPKIYVIGGSINDIPSNNVWIFDTFTDTDILPIFRRQLPTTNRHFVKNNFPQNIYIGPAGKPTCRRYFGDKNRHFRHWPLHPLSLSSSPLFIFSKLHRLRLSLR